MEGGKPVIITNVEGQRTTPSVVAWTKNGDRLHYWHVLKEGVMAVFQESFEFGTFKQSFNASFITLMPKKGEKEIFEILDKLVWSYYRSLAFKQCGVN
ncbi:hypothetical protein RJ640_012277 [Escallonia rubra]|uniref:Uncharacterized protein n=1 Tax=Escallonia rubra TaxID=112253 RepID=A0AA88QPX0_9ASTE|nr:hypothetical protein RJ640_012277 [Escallonia rubra]